MAHAMRALEEPLGSKINYATVFRRGVEEGILDPRQVIQIGPRGTRYSAEDTQYGYDVGMRVVTMDDFETGPRAIVKIVDRMGWQ